MREVMMRYFDAKGIDSLKNLVKHFLLSNLSPHFQIMWNSLCVVRNLKMLNSVQSSLTLILKYRKLERNNAYILSLFHDKMCLVRMCEMNQTPVELGKCSTKILRCMATVRLRLFQGNRGRTSDHERRGQIIIGLHNKDRSALLVHDVSNRQMTARDLSSDYTNSDIQKIGGDDAIDAVVDFSTGLRLLPWEIVGPWYHLLLMKSLWTFTKFITMRTFCFWFWLKTAGTDSKRDPFLARVSKISETYW